MSQYKICIVGGAEGINAERAYGLARKVGEEIAKKGHVLITGATTGVPFEAAEAAKKVGGSNIGFSPAGSEVEHQKKFRLPMDPKIFDHIIYTEAGYAGRNMLMVRSADATIMIDGRVGTLNEFTVAFEENEIVGVLEGSGGTADLVRLILEKARKGSRKVIFDTDPVNKNCSSSIRSNQNRRIVRLFLLKLYQQRIIYSFFFNLFSDHFSRKIPAATSYHRRFQTQSRETYCRISSSSTRSNYQSFHFTLSLIRRRNSLTSKKFVAFNYSQ